MLLFVLLSVDVLTDYRLRWVARSGGV